MDMMGLCGVINMIENINNKKQQDMKQTNSTTVQQTIDVLSNPDNEVWKEIYRRYAEQIIRNKKKYGENARLFQPKEPLLSYSSIGKASYEGQTTAYDLRFAGQSVGLIEVNKDWNCKVKLTVTERQAKYAKDHFGFKNSNSFERKSWKEDREAIEFRKFYMDNKSTQDIAIKSQEHRIESELLKEFNKTLRKQNKLLCNIQPVKLGGKFFQLTTPLKGSTHVPTISLTSNKKGATGGGIDILARVKHEAFKSRLAVIELKDENLDNESQEVAMFQALIYTTFIAHLLRSDSGKLWWYIFLNKKGEKDKLNKITDFSDFNKIKELLKDVPEKLHIDVVTLMPKGNSKEGDFKDIRIDKLNVCLHLYSLYYDVDENGNPSHFSGTLKEALK